MMRISILAAILLALLAGSGRMPAQAAGHEADSPNGIAPREVYIRLYPLDGYVYFREYIVSTPLAADARIKAQVGRIRDLVGNTEFARSEYDFRHFRLRQEKLYEDRGFLTAEHHITTDERNLKKLMEDSFGRILRRDVEVTINKTDIGLHFDRTGLASISSPTAKGAFTRKEDSRAVIFWRNGVDFYEAVFTYEWDEKRYKSLLPYFGGDLASPER